MSLVYRLTFWWLTFAVTLCVWISFNTLNAIASEKVVYFTFDDGPSLYYTPKILDVLKSNHVHATFFVLGKRCVEFPDIVRREQREGHTIGTHGYDHRSIQKQSHAFIQYEVSQADDAIARVTGKKPLYYRPTYGGIDEQERPIIQKMGHPIVLWSVDSHDWNAKGEQSIIQNVIRRVQPGSIVLFHDGISSSRYTLQALPSLIQYFKHEGYTIQCFPN